MLTPWKESYDQPRQHIKKQRHYFANKGPSSQCYGFSSSQVWMWELCTIMKAECWRIDAFELRCWRRLLKVPWITRRSRQSILKEIIPEYSLERLMLKQKLQYFSTWCEELTHWKRPWCWERLRARGEEGQQSWAVITNSMDMSLSKVRGLVMDMLQSMRSQRAGHDWVTELNWI